MDLPDIQSALLATYRKKRQKITCAESCTAGMVAAALTDLPGSSEIFDRGFVTYSNAAKLEMLGVLKTTLDQHGAVSEQVAREMALGAMDRSGADYAIAVSGIAGPDGGTADKPVGTVWLAWGNRDTLRTRNLCWPVERTLFQTMIAAAGLDMLRRMLLGIDDEPVYFSQRSVRRTQG